MKKRPMKKQFMKEQPMRKQSMKEQSMKEQPAKKFHKITFIILLAASLLSLSACGNQATASVMRLMKTEGTVQVSDGDGKDIALFDQMKLYSGYSLLTKKESYAWINLDSTKLAKMDVESEIAIQKKKKNLEIVVNSGSLYFNITERLSEDETLNIKSSTMSVGIHGTCGWVEAADTQHMKVYILEGTVQCTVADSESGKSKTINVSGGEMAEMELYPDGQKAYDITKSKFTEQDIAGFVLSEVAQEEDLCEKILEESGLDVPSRWEEVKPEPTPTPVGGLDAQATVTPGSSVEDPSSQGTAGDYAIDWRDANLEAAMREATGIYGRDIMQSDVIGRESLNLLYSDIEDISALGELKNLTRLGLSGNKITDISALGNLTGLTELTLAENQITDISALGSLVNLTSLSLDRNQISELGALANLTSLKSLHIAENQLANLDGLQNLTALTDLYLTDNQITDISALGSLKSLTTLSLNSNQIEDIAALKNLTGLAELYLENNQITDVNALKNLKNLTKLDLVGNPITDYSPIEFVPNIFR